MPSAEKANSVMLVRPIGTKPTERSRAMTGASRVARDVEQILDRDRNARERRGRRVLAPELVDGVGGHARGLAIDLQEGPLAFAGRVLDALDALVDQRAARLPGVEPGGDLGQAAHGSIGLAG